MNRRTQLKLEEAKLFARKYIFSGRFIVRNTLVVMGAATLVGSGIFTANVIERDKVASSTVSALVSEEVEAEVEAPDTYSITLNEASLLEDDSVDTLYSYLDDEDVLTASNDTQKLTKSETDMTGKFIVATEGLYLRAEASTDGNIITMLNTGDEGTVIGDDGDWTMVSVDNEEGYVKTEFILTDDEATKVAEQAKKDGTTFRDVIGVEEVQVAEATTEATTQATTETVAQATTQTTTQATTEATTQATTQATTEATTQAATEAPVAADSSDLYLLAAIVYAESGGESYEGQLAVASVVMNRVRNGYWGSSISSVIYAPSQFSGAYTSAFQNALTTGGSSTSLQAAQDALNGANNIGGCMYFRPTWNIDTSTLGSYTQIGNHIFY